MGIKSGANCPMRCIILGYLFENREPFQWDEFVNTLYEAGKIEEEDKEAARKELDHLYGEGLIVPQAFPPNGELKCVYMIGPKDDVLYYLKQNGSKEKIDKIIDYLYKQYNISHEQTKVAILDLICDKKVMYDQITNEIYIPR